MILPSEPLIGLAAGLAAILVYVIIAWRGGAWGESASQRWMTLGWVLHALTVWGSLSTELGVPRFGFAAALSATAWLVLTFYTLERHWFPQLGARLVLSGMGAVTVGIITAAGLKLLLALLQCRCRCQFRCRWVALDLLRLLWLVSLVAASARSLRLTKT